MKQLIIAILILLTVLFGNCSPKIKQVKENSSKSFGPTLILVSFDGCRYDYPNLSNTPALDEIEAGGIKADGLKTSFPSKTFPNHLSIVTGLFPENHGIIANRIYDDTTGESYTLGNGAPTQSKWYQGEPIWVTAERQGLKTAPFFWPGSEAEINGYRPTYYRAYDHDLSYEKRVTQILDWLDLSGEKRPQFLSLYFDEPDHSGHVYGPASTQAIAALENVDKQLVDLLNGIKSRQLEDKVNIMVVSDHGMTSLSREKVVFLDDYIDMEDVLIVDNSPVVAIRPDHGKTEAVYQQLKDVHPHMQVYRKEEVPDKYHYNDHKFIQPIIGILDLGWSATTHDYFNSHPNYPGKGTHGFDPDYQDMNAIFYAKGPAFKKGVQLPVIQNIHLYELMCAVLKIDPAPNDGNLGEVKVVLAE